MKEQLELKYLAPYLPYGVNVRSGDDAFEVTAMNNRTVFFKGGLLDIKDIKLILRPLSDLTKDIEHNGKKFVPYDLLRDMELKDMRLHSDGCLTINQRNIQKCEYWRMVKLFEWHFDVFGLIDKGLAIDINTLND